MSDWDLHILTLRLIISFLVVTISPCRAFVGTADKRLIREFDPNDFPCDEWPYTDQDLSRLDNLPDSIFYTVPKLVTHIDDRAIAALTGCYREEMNKALNEQKQKKKSRLDVLDLCSSWISYLPNDMLFGKVIGLGMNPLELQANGQLTEWIVQDLNRNPIFEDLEDESFDVVCNVVSVDYLIRPKEVFGEIYRVLRPGGIALVSFSNRCFPTKAVKMWLEALEKEGDGVDDMMARLSYIVASYFHYSSGKWDCIQAFDIIPEKLKGPNKPPGIRDVLQDPSRGFNWLIAASAIQQSNTYRDPLVVVKAVK